MLRRLTYPRALFAAALVATVTAAHARPYAFLPITDLTGDIGFTAPALNDAGDIVQGMAPGGQQKLVLYPRGGSPTTYLDTSGPLAGFTSLSPIPLNNSRTIAFRGTLDTGAEGIFTYGGGRLTTIADTSGQFSGFGPPPSLPALNASGSLAFTGQLKSGDSGVFVGNGASTTTIADTSSGRYTGFSGLGVSLNDRGDVAALANLPDGGQALLLSRGGGPATPIVDTSGPLSSFGQLFDLNNSGALAFVGNLDAGGQGIFLWNDGVLTPIAETGAVLSGVFNPSVNNRGTISFYATLVEGGHVLYLYVPAEGLRRVIGSGDTLFGSTILTAPAGPLTNRAIFTSVNSLNDLDEIGMHVRFSDGRLMAVLATPIPEPSRVSLLAIGTATVVLVLKRRGRKSEREWMQSRAAG